MSENRSQIEETISALKQQRDELAVQMHLANMEAKEEFERAKQRLEKLTAEYEPLKSSVKESTGNVMSALSLVGEEILASFRRIRKSLE